MSFEEVDSIPYTNENGDKIPHKRLERQEQLDAWEFIPSDACVLELGGRYGMVSCVINQKLQQRENHVVVEPDLTVHEALLLNRKTHGASFSVWPGIVSKRQLFLNAMGFSTYCSDISNAYPVAFCSPSDLQVKTGIPQFTHLVADCEGGLLFFWEDFPEFFDNLQGIYFELDNNGPTIISYETFIQFLESKGFVQEKQGKRQFWIRSPENSKPSE